MQSVLRAADAAGSVRLMCTAGLVEMLRACCCCHSDLRSEDSASRRVQSPLAILSVPLLFLHCLDCEPCAWYWCCCRVLARDSKLGEQRSPVSRAAGPALASRCCFGPSVFGCAVGACETGLELAASEVAQTAAGSVGAGQQVPALGESSTPLSAKQIVRVPTGTRPPTIICIPRKQIPAARRHSSE